ncbi:hypothetical protein U1Q18_041148 [Sarracenia purpurea var. burkii]
MYSSFIAATQSGDLNASATVLGSIGEDGENKGTVGLRWDKGTAGLRLDKKEDELLRVAGEKQMDRWEDLDLGIMGCVLSEGLGKIGIVNEIGGGLLEKEGEEL